MGNGLSSTPSQDPNQGPDYASQRQDQQEAFDPTETNLGEKKAKNEAFTWGTEEDPGSGWADKESENTYEIIEDILDPVVDDIEGNDQRVAAEISTMRIMCRELIDSLKPEYDRRLNQARTAEEIIAAEDWLRDEIKTYQLVIESYFKRMVFTSQQEDAGTLAAASRNFLQVQEVLAHGEPELIVAFKWAGNPNALTEKETYKQMNTLIDFIDDKPDQVFLAVRQLDYENKLKFFKTYQSEIHGDVLANIDRSGKSEVDILMEATQGSVTNTIAKIKEGVAKGCIPPVEAENLINAFAGDDESLMINDNTREELTDSYTKGLEDETFLAEVYERSSRAGTNPWMGNDLIQRGMVLGAKVWLASILAANGIVQSVHSWRTTEGVTGFIGGVLPFMIDPWTLAAGGGLYALDRATGDSEPTDSESKAQNERELYRMKNSEYSWLTAENANVVAEWYTENGNMHQYDQLNEQFDQFLVTKLEDSSGDLTPEKKAQYEDMLNKRRQLNAQGKLDNDDLLDLAVVLREVGIRGLNEHDDESLYNHALNMGGTGSAPLNQSENT
ncbi:hypothetical protein ACFL21_03755 [Patescibacteria group bacterium]